MLQKLAKSEIAKRQLDVAVDLYLHGGDYLAIVTLAGAAEEILGQLLRRMNRKAMMGHIMDIDRKISGGRGFRVVNAEVNRARNALKHARDGDEDPVEIDSDEAGAMLLRALVNYKEFSGELSEAMSKALARLREKHLGGQSGVSVG